MPATAWSCPEVGGRGGESRLRSIEPRACSASALSCCAGATATGAVYCLAERDGLLFSGGYDQLVRVWDYRMMRCINELAGHTGAVRALAVHNNRLLSGSVDGTVRLWDNFLGVPRAS